MTRNDHFHVTEAHARERADARIATGDLTDRDRAALRLFLSEVQATAHIRGATRDKISVTMMGLHRFAPAPFTEMTTADAYLTIDRVAHGDNHRGRPLSQSARHDMVKHLKRFLLWLVENDLAGPGLSAAKIRKIRPPPKPRMTKTAAMLLDPAEIRGMIQAARSSRDRALIATLYEGGFRIGEVASLTWRQVEFNDWRAAVNVDAKTDRPRFVPLVMARAYLAAWRADYPGDPAPDAWVFLTRYGEPFGYQGIKKVLTSNARRAGVTKHITPHLFRHSRITHLLREGVAESTIKLMLWGTITTTMFGTYAHLAAPDIERELQVHHGLVDKHRARDRSADPVQCPGCHAIVGPTHATCPDCAYPLTDEAAATLEMLRRDLYQPDVLRAIARGIEDGTITRRPGPGHNRG